MRACSQGMGSWCGPAPDVPRLTRADLQPDLQSHVPRLQRGLIGPAQGKRAELHLAGAVQRHHLSGRQHAVLLPGQRLQRHLHRPDLQLCQRARCADPELTPAQQQPCMLHRQMQYKRSRLLAIYWDVGYASKSNAVHSVVPAHAHICGAYQLISGLCTGACLQPHDF